MNTGKNELLIKILIYGLIAFAVIMLLGHFFEKHHIIFVSQNSTAEYINDKDIDGKQKSMMLDATKEAQFKQTEDSVSYHTYQMKVTTDLSMNISRLTQLHFDILRTNNSKEIIPYANEEIDEIRSNLEYALGTMGNVVPPAGQEYTHNFYLENVTEAILELEEYRDDVNNQRVQGPAPNPHIIKLKSIFSSLQLSPNTTLSER